MLVFDSKYLKGSMKKHVKVTVATLVMFCISGHFSYAKNIFDPSKMKENERINQEIEDLQGNISELQTKLDELKKIQSTYVHVNGDETKNTASGDNETNFGPSDEASGAIGKYSIAIGERAKSIGEKSMAIGNGAKTEKDAKNGIAIGSSSSAQGENAVSLGNEAHATRSNSLAFGSHSISNGENSITIGKGSKIDSSFGNIIGTDSVINQNAMSATIIGNKSSVSEGSNDGIVIGNNSHLGKDFKRGEHGAILQDSFGGAMDSILIGGKSSVGGYNAIGIGDNLHLQGFNTIAIGSGNEIKALSTVAIGSGVKVYGKSLDYIVAIGTGAEVNKNKGVAIGASTKVNEFNSIALGNKSWVEKNEENVLSIGHKDGDHELTRKIIHVSKGDISATSTDAINGSQLYEKDKEIRNHIKEINNSYVHVNHGQDMKTKSFDNSGEVDSIGGAMGMDSISIGVEAKSIGEQSLAMGKNSFAGFNDYVEDKEGKFAIINGEPKEFKTHEEAKNASKDNKTYTYLDPKTNKNAYIYNLTGLYAKDNNGNFIKYDTKEAAAAAASKFNDKKTYSKKGDLSLAIGYKSYAENFGSIAFGYKSKSTGYKAMALGNKAVVTGSNSTAIGFDTKVNGDNALGLGEGSTTTSEGAIAIGNRAYAGLGFTEDKNGKYIKVKISKKLTDGRKESLEKIIPAEELDKIAQELKILGKKVDIEVKMGKAGNNSYVKYDRDKINKSEITKFSQNKTGGDFAIAVGNNAIATDTFATSFGNNAVAGNKYSLSLGGNSKSTGLASTAIGFNSKAIGDKSIGIGFDSNVSGNKSIAIGNESFAGFRAVDFRRDDKGSYIKYKDKFYKLTNGKINYNGEEIDPTKLQEDILDFRYTYDIVKMSNDSQGRSYYKQDENGDFGKVVLTSADNKTTYDVYVKLDADGRYFDPATGEMVKYIGNRYENVGEVGAFNVAIGYQATAPSKGSTSLGYNTHAIGDHSIALGNITSSIGDHSVAIGNKTISKGSESLAIGYDSISNGNHSLALGHEAKALGDKSLAIGDEIKSNKENNISLGSHIENASINGIAIGNNINLKKDDSLAIGNNAQVTQHNSVALGNDSIADRWDVVSVGNANKTRQIINVSAGTKDTDAVNLGQLNQKAEDIKNLGFRVSVLKPASGEVVKYGHVNLGGIITIAGDYIGGNNIKIKNISSDGGVHLDFELSHDLNYIDSIGNIKDITGSRIKFGSHGYDIAIGRYDKAKKFIPITFTGVKDGSSTYDAVNFGQLSQKADKKDIENKLNVDGTNINGDENQKSLGKNVGTSDIKNGGTKLVQADAVKNYIDGKILNGQGEIENQKISYKANDEDKKEVKLTEGFTFENTDNLTADVQDNGIIKYSLNKDIKNIDSISLKNNLKITEDNINFASKNGIIDGLKTIDKNNDKDKFKAVNREYIDKILDDIPRPDEKTITITQIDGKDKLSAKTANIEINDGNFEVKDKDALIKASEVAKHLDKGIKFTGNNGEILTKLGEEIKIQADSTNFDDDKISTGNLKVVAGSNALDIKMSKDLKNLDSVAGENTKINFGTSEISLSTQNKENVVLTGVADGKTNNDAVNFGQLNKKADISEMNKKLNIDGSNINGEENQKSLGKNVGTSEISNDINATKLVQEGAVRKAINTYEEKAKKELGKLTISYKASGEDKKEVKLTDGFTFENSNNLTAEAYDKGIIKYSLNKDIKNINSISFGENKLKINENSINFANNNGIIDGLEDIKSDSKDENLNNRAVNKKYVDEKVKSIHIDDETKEAIEQLEKKTISIESTDGSIVIAGDKKSKFDLKVNVDNDTIKLDGGKLVAKVAKADGITTTQDSEKKISVIKGKLSQDTKGNITSNNDNGFVTSKNIKDILNNGLTFVGNDGNFKSYIGNTINIKGDTDDNKAIDSARDNIKVVVKDNNLTISLNKNLQNISSISNGENSKITFNGENIDFNGGELHNVGQAKDTTDAVNLGQLNQIRDEAKKELNDKIQGKLNIVGDNVGDKNKFGENVGIEKIDESTSLVQASAVKNYVDDKTSEINKTIADQTISYKANDETEIKKVKLSQGFVFKDGTNISAQAEKDGIIKFNLNKTLNVMEGINFGTDSNNPNIKIFGGKDNSGNEHYDIEFKDNNGLIKGLKDIAINDKSDLTRAVNQKYVDNKFDEIPTADNNTIKVEDKKLYVVTADIEQDENDKEIKVNNPFALAKAQDVARVLNKGLNFAVGEKIVNKKLGETLKFVGDENIKVSIDEKSLNLNLNKDLQNISSLSNENGARITLDKDVNLNGGKITNLAKAEITENSKDAVIGSQIYEIKNDIDSKIQNINSDKLNISGDNIAKEKATDKEKTEAQKTFGKNIGTSDIENGDTSLVQAKAVKEKITAINNEISNQTLKISDINGEVSDIKLSNGLTFTGDKNIIAKVEKSGKISYTLNKKLEFSKLVIDGENGKITGLADGIEDTDAVNKKQLDELKTNIQTGQAGIIVYTDKDGNKVTKENNKYFVPKTGKEINASDIEVSLVSPNGNTKIALRNLKNNFEVIDSKASTDATTRLKEFIDDNGNKYVLSNAVTLGDLKTLVVGGINFNGNKGEGQVHTNLGETIRIKGEGKLSKNTKTASDNILVSTNADEKELDIKLATDLKNMTSFKFTQGTVINNTTINFAENKGEIKGLHDLDENSDSHMAANKNYVDTNVKGINDKITNVKTELDDKIENNKSQIEKNTKTIEKHEKLVNQYKEIVDNNKVNIEKNTQEINNVKERVKENEGKIVVIQDQVEKNKNSVIENTQKINNINTKVNTIETKITKDITNFKEEQIATNKEIKDDISKKADKDAKNLEVSDKKAWRKALGTDKVEKGNEELVTSGAVYDFVSKQEGQNKKYEKAIEKNSKDIQKVKTKVKNSGALSAALAGLHPMAYDPHNKDQIMAALGSYEGKQAVAVGMTHYVNSNLMVNVGGSVTTDNKPSTMMNAGFTYKLGSSPRERRLLNRKRTLVTLVMR